MLRNVLKINEITARDIMIPRANISAVETNDTLDSVLNIFLKEAHSRAPVYEKNLDNIIGMVHIKDLLKYKIKNGTDKSIFLQSIKREILKVPPSMPVLDLLMKMQLTRIHMAVVIDEYGGSDGLLTIEDVIEEITGEIEDEHDQQNIPMLTIVKGTAYTRLNIFLYTILLVPITFIPILFMGFDYIYGFAAFVLNIGFLYLAYRVFKEDDSSEKSNNYKHSKALFKYSIAYLFFIFLSLAVDSKVSNLTFF